MKVYFEAGANDGVNQSRTLKYKDNLEWTGILVEPDPRCRDALFSNRGNDRTHIFDCGLSLNSGIMEIYEHETPLMNTPVLCREHHTAPDNFLSKFKVESRTIQSIAEELKIDCIDEMYLDVEGFEVEVLKGIYNLNIKYLEVECHYHNTSNREVEQKNIIEQANRLNLKLSNINLAEGHPKLEFTI